MSLSWFNLPIEPTLEKTIMAGRMAIGVVISFVITNYFEIIDSTWVYISLFVVLFEQKTIGASLIRGSMRTIATLSSAIFSLFIICLFQNDYLMNLLGFIIGTFLYTYLFLGTKKSYIGALGSVTLAICLINYNDFSHVFIRPTNVIIGILIGLFSLRFFFPQRATKILILQTQRFLMEYANLSNDLAHYDALKIDLHERLVQLESNVMTLIPLFQTLMNEAKIETQERSKFTQINADILLSLRHIFRYYASIIASILFENVQLNEDDKNNLLFLSQTLTHLKDNLSALKRKHQFIDNDDLITQEDKKLVPLMLHLIFLECRALNTKINQLLRSVKTIKLE